MQSSIIASHILQMYYADTTAFNVASSSSLEDLNSRLASPLKMDVFRPNIVISGAPPFAEDDWLYLRIGQAVLRKVKPCERCETRWIFQYKWFLLYVDIVTLVEKGAHFFF